MHKFKPENFFDLSVYAHASLFQKGAVWEALLSLKEYILNLKLGTISGKIHPTAVLENESEISIGSGTVVEAGAYIRGPCVIGSNCEVRHGAYIRGNCVTGNKVVIGHATEVKNALFLDGAQAGHFAYIGDSILGNRVNLGAGAKCANLRFDHQEIMINNTKTHLRKLGAILGDDVQIGCNAVTNPGTLMGKKSSCYPCVTVHGMIPSGMIVKGRYERTAQ